MKLWKGDSDEHTQVQADRGHSVPHLQACVVGRNINECTASSIHDIAVGMSQQQHKKLVDAPLCHQKPDRRVAREIAESPRRLDNGLLVGLQQH